jgi:hypothetical protein
MDATTLIVGIDVSKNQLDVHVRGSGESFVVPRDAEGLDPGVASGERLHLRFRDHRHCGEVKRVEGLAGR